MQSRHELALGSSCNEYVTKAEQLESVGKNALAAKAYLMAGRILLASAPKVGGAAQSDNLRRAATLLSKARALGGEHGNMDVNNASAFVARPPRTCDERGNADIDTVGANTVPSSRTRGERGSMDTSPIGAATVRSLRMGSERGRAYTGAADAIGNKPPASRQAQPRASADAPEPRWQPEPDPGVKFADVAGLDEPKRIVCERVILPLKRPKLFGRYGLRPGGGVLLYGLPGTGKTTFAKAVASECGAAFFHVACSDITSKWLGESERNVAELFECAAHPDVGEKQLNEDNANVASVIFFDDFDGLGALRTEQSGAMNRIVAELLMRMQGFSGDGSNILLLAATNRPWAIDGAFLRAGRFGERIYVPLPDEPARRQLMQNQLRSAPLDDDINIPELARLTAGLNGADVAEVCNMAKLSAALRACAASGDDSAITAEPVTRADMLNAIKRHPSSVSRHDVGQLIAYMQSEGLELPPEL